MSEAKHSPLPWKAVFSEGHVGVDVRAANGRAVAATFGVANQAATKEGMARQAEEDRANARLIVAAVKSHQKLVDALRSAVVYGVIPSDATKLLAELERSNG